ncbi:polysaccharide deacetylase family protein [Paenibacillus lentus]|uniref:Polysaccharide deacetylase family protein n=1 Tax=Paenibacillus lentus TaxID=1338368 RepID=A0A3Q8S9R3_9BACL|nr:polysaccharide deacetylase family protein [Paenibacillus lentus]AZK45691.1 polysaccharide deacetylase family protein [Paenibacillus lentus]
MSVQVYQVKLLELHSVHRDSNQSYLRIKLISDQETELLWNVDDWTAKNLQAIIDPEGIYKYRLSFNSSWNSAQNQYVSYLTKTYRDQSERIYFSCSETYVSGLKSLKNNEPLSQIQVQSPLPKSLTPRVSLVRHSVKVNKLNDKLTWSAIGVLSLVFMILFGSSMPTFIYKAASSENTGVTIIESEMNRNIGGYVAGHRAVTVNAQFNTVLNNEPSVPLYKPKEFDEKAEHLENLEDMGTIDAMESVDPILPELPFTELDDLITYSLPKGKVALTFDDGPSKYTEKIADILKEHQAGGTFFFVGKNLNKYPESVQYVKSNGYAIGSHGMNHLELTKLSDVKQKYEIMHPNELIEKLIGEPVVLFRPPYGAKDDSVIDVIRELNHKMVLWDVDTKDWESRDAQKIYNSVAKTNVNGSIILLHESQATLDALPQIIEFLKEQNLDIVNLR